MGFKAPHQIISLGREAAKEEKETLKQALHMKREDEILCSPWGCWNKKPRKTSGLEWVVVGWQHEVRCLAAIQDGAATEVGASEVLLQQGL